MPDLNQAWFKWVMNVEPDTIKARKLRCFACFTTYDVSGFETGTRVKCAKCGTRLTVPAYSRPVSSEWKKFRILPPKGATGHLTDAMTLSTIRSQRVTSSATPNAPWQRTTRNVGQLPASNSRKAGVVEITKIAHKIESSRIREKTGAVSSPIETRTAVTTRKATSAAQRSQHQKETAPPPPRVETRRPTPKRSQVAPPVEARDADPPRKRRRPTTVSRRRGPQTIPTTQRSPYFVILLVTGAIALLLLVIIIATAISKRNNGNEARPPSLEEQYADKVNSLGEQDAEGHYALGLWCRDNGLEEKAVMHFERAVAIQPDHEKARAALGHEKYWGAWLSRQTHAAFLAEDRRHVIAVSEKTKNDPAWKPAIEALLKKHASKVITYDWPETSLLRQKLSELMPRYVCFLASPEEATRGFVIEVHTMMRMLDDDPYGDALWGILTGYEPEDVLRIISHGSGSKIRKVLGGCGVNLNMFVEGAWYSEGTKNEKWIKEVGKDPQKTTCPDDTTACLVGELNRNDIDMMVTSGHATEHDWQIGYTYPNGTFRCENGQLFGLDLAGKRYDINTNNPKIYHAPGNCLIGHIPHRNCMALAWMRSGGACQMMGYTVVTWYGAMGWGTGHYFIELSDTHSYAEAFFASNQAIVYRLRTHYPDNADVIIREFDIERDPGLYQRLIVRHRIKDRDNLGLLWDKNVVAFYGDPAWDARLEKVGVPLYNQELAVSHIDDGEFRLTIGLKFNRECSLKERPAIVFLPFRIADARLKRSDADNVVITDNFIMIVESDATVEAGARREVVVDAKRVRWE